MSIQKICGVFLLMAYVSLIPFAHAVRADSAFFFSDTKGHWAASIIEELRTTCGVEGLRDASGNPLHTFAPDILITRAELTQLMVQCFSPTEKATLGFSDVQTGSWYEESIMKAVAAGWIQGYKDGSVRPMDPILRAEAVTMLMRAKTVEISLSSTVFFSDVPQDSWFSDAVLRARQAGIISGKADGLFHPEEMLTRAEAAKIVMRTLTFTPQKPTACTIFPKDNPWNTDISQYPVHANSNAYMSRMLQGRKTLHPDFGSDPSYGIPYVEVGVGQPTVKVTATAYPEESDEGYFPIPDNAPVEAGGDHHVLVVDMASCMLYELYNAVKVPMGWNADASSVFDLTSNDLRPDYWTSADAAGLPIFPGLVRYDEVAAGEIAHALRFTMSKTQRAFMHPATHYASSASDADLPPMGLRVRLKKDVDLSPYTGHTKIILQALQTYGMILADNGSDWFISGSTDSRWNDEDLQQLKSVPASFFEVVDMGEPLIK